MGWLQLTEMVEDTEAAVAEPKTDKDGNPVPAEAAPLKEETRVVEVPHEARLTIPTSNGSEFLTFGEYGLTKVEFLSEDPNAEEATEEAAPKAVAKAS